MMVCEPCSEGIRAYLAGTGSSGGRFMRALLLGVGAAAIGAIVYGLWMHFTKSEFALVTIAIGWFVGKAVRKGSGGLGGNRPAKVEITGPHTLGGTPPQAPAGA